MKIKYSIIKSEFQSNILIVEYNDIKLDFDIDALNNKQLSDQLFVTINKYLSCRDNEINEKIFSILNEFYLFKSKYTNYNDKNTIKYIEDTLCILNELFNLSDFKNWLKWNTNEFNFPSDLIDEFIYDQDLTVTKEKTYTKTEYQNLLANILDIRFLLPILADIYTSVKGINKHAYFQTLCMLTNTDIINSEELTKLRTYILEIQKSISTGNNKNEYYILLKGLSSDDVNEYILAEIIFTKLLFIDYLNSKSNIIGFIYQTIKFKTGYSSADSEVIRSIGVKGENKKDDTSCYEDYRKTTNISLGNVVEIQHFLSNNNSIINNLKLTNFYNEQEYKNELVYTYKLNKFKINKIQIILLGLLLHKYVNPRTLYYIDNKKIIELLTLMSVVLWNSNQKFISILLTSNVNETSNYINNVIKFSLSKEESNMLNSKYSYFAGSKALSSSSKNLIEDNIIEIAKEINNNIWIPNCSIEKIKEFNNDNVKGLHLYVPLTLIKELVIFTLFCNN